MTVKTVYQKGKGKIDMKKRKHWILWALFALLLTVCLVTAIACTGGKDDTGDTTAADKTDGEQSQTTDPAESSGSEETTGSDETGSGSAEETSGNAEEKRVRYEVEEVTIQHTGYADEKLGMPVHERDDNVTKLLGANFSSGDATLDGLASARNLDVTSVSDGKFRMPYSNGAFGGSWTTWAPEVSMAFDRYKQVQLSCNMMVPTADGNANWFGAFWGCYVSNYTEKIPDNPGDGLWFSFSRENKLTVYGADIASWAGGLVSLDLPVSVADAEQEITILCTPERTTTVYAMVNGTREVVCKVTFEDGIMRIYNGKAEQVYEHAADVSTLSGDHFVLFTHMGSIQMDNLKILGCDRDYVETKKTIKAIPADGYSLGLDYDHADELISICYSIWFDGILGSGTDPVTDFNNITEALEGKRNWGGVTAFHYWAKPAQGYYRSSDKAAARNNLQLLGDAGVDFLILDLTNHNDGYAIGSSLWNAWVKAPIETLLDCIMEMRSEGKTVPYVVMWCGVSAEGKLLDDLYNTFFAEEKWKDCFVYSEGKPFMLTTQKPIEFKRRDLYTVRKMWGLTNDRNSWRFLSVDNTNTVAKDKNKNPEQIGVAVASQETYMSEPTAHGRDGGRFWNKQWQEAFRVHPKVVTLTWWNEWAAQMFMVDGKRSFVDNYNQEYSRDIEPMAGGHGDQYYKWLCEYIRAYRAHEECPELIEK